jgi:hypothetical protein
MPEYEVQFVMKGHCSQRLVDDLDRRLKGKFEIEYDIRNGGYVRITSLPYYHAYTIKTWWPNQAARKRTLHTNDR